MYKLLQVFQQPVTEGPGVYSLTTHLWEIIIMLLGTAILGYLVGYYFSKSKTVVEKPAAKTLTSATPELNEWEGKYKGFQVNYEQNKLEWQQKHKSSEDRAKTYQAQLTEIKNQQEKIGVEKAEALSKLKAMEAQRNEALEAAKKTVSELMGASENIKAQQEKINTLSSALAMASNIKKETPKPVVLSDDELTKKFEAETAALKKQLEEKDKRVIALLSKEAAANELRLRNDKLASENKIFRNEMAEAKLDTDTAIQKAEHLKELQLQILTLSNKAALAHGETTTLKKQLADQQKRHNQQAGKLNELRISIGQERTAMKAKIAALENELAPFKPVPEPVAVPENEQMVETVAQTTETETSAPVVKQTVIESPAIDTTPVVIDVPAPFVQEVLPETKTELFTTEEKSTNSFPPDDEAAIKPLQTETATFPADEHPIHPLTTDETSEETPVGKRNDLLLVQGVDAKLKAALEAKGINDWNKLAKTNALTLKEILGDEFASINPKSWPIQAQLLADGKWDAFTSYTKYLIGGVDPSEVNA